MSTGTCRPLAHAALVRNESADWENKADIIAWDKAEVGLQDGLSVVEKASKTHGSKIEVVES